MRWPVERFKEDWNLTAGLSFGQPTSYGFHDGWDLNLNGAGDSDLGKEIFAISNGDLVYWHGAKHPTTGFGYHSVYKIQGSFGTRWVHQTHCMPDITPAPKAITENERIARVGKSGLNPNDPDQKAHIHFSMFKVDPATLPDGIDTLAKTQQQLNDWWEDPIKFIEKQLQPIDELPQCKIDRDTNWNIAVVLFSELGVPLDPNNKELSKQNAINAIRKLNSDLSELEIQLKIANDKLTRNRELAQQIINE